MVKGAALSLAAAAALAGCAKGEAIEPGEPSGEVATSTEASPTLTPEQQQYNDLIKRLDKMTPEEFDQESVENKAAWALSKYTPEESVYPWVTITGEFLSCIQGEGWHASDSIAWRDFPKYLPGTYDGVPRDMLGVLLQAYAQEAVAGMQCKYVDGSPTTDSDRGAKLILASGPSFADEDQGNLNAQEVEILRSNEANFEATSLMHNWHANPATVYFMANEDGKPVIYEDDFIVDGKPTTMKYVLNLMRPSHDENAPGRANWFFLLEDIAGPDGKRISYFVSGGHPPADNPHVQELRDAVANLPDPNLGNNSVSVITYD